jgi:hypothetical protein
MAQKMTDSYAAAMLEARGRLQTNNGGTRRDYRPLVSITFADPDIARAFREHMGAGTIETFNPHSNPTMELHAWRCRGVQAVGVLERLTPHMLGVLREHAEYIIERDRTRHNEKVA